MDRSKLIKSQRRRYNERVKKEQAAKLGPIPDYLKKYAAASQPKIIADELQAWQKAPPHMVDYDLEDMWDTPTVKSDAQRQITDEAGKLRSEDRDDKLQELKALYPEDWKQRGGAKRIASFEAEAGRPIAVRTVQRYIRADKKRQHQGCHL
jgi:hypothetical protein